MRENLPNHHVEDGEDYNREERTLYRLSPSITSISLYLSLNLSALLQDLKGK